MKLSMFIQKAFTKIATAHRKAYFRAITKCPHKDFEIYGKMTLINPNVKVGKNVAFYPDVMLFGDGPIVIGDNVDIGNGTIIYSSKKDGGVYIGDNTVIATQCYIIDMDHGIQGGELIRNQKNIVAPIHIGEDVWIASGAKILKGSNIRNGAVIGAQSVVKGEIEENAIAVGIPAKVKKYREFKNVK